MGLVLLVACGDDEPTGPSPSEWQIRSVAGSGQFGVPGGTLSESFRVEVRKIAGGTAQSGVRVDWRVTSGSGASVSPASSVTGSDGSAEARLTLGSEVGAYQVQASFEGLVGSPAVFTAQAVSSPVITGVPDEPVAAGNVISVTGTNFSPTPLDNAVLFSGIRGAVLQATSTELQVEVPSCMPPRNVDVTVAFGSVESNSVPLTVIGQPASLNLDLGEDITIKDPDALSCVHLPSEAGARYLAVVQTTSQVATALYEYSLVTRRAQGGVPAPPAALARRADVEGGAGLSGGTRRRTPTLTPQGRWERVLRGLEREAIRSGARPGVRGDARDGARDGARRGARRRSALRSSQTLMPDVGDRDDFTVLDKDREFQDVTGEIVFIGERVIIYEDVARPAGGLTMADYEAFANVVDDPIVPTVTEVFGQLSDLDQNGKVVILFTPVVNELTPPGSAGFIGGFFFGNDLLIGRNGSNEAEIFYMVVPDPQGEHSDARDRDLVNRVVPGILGHEIQHMIHFNERILVRGASSQEAVWLAEGLAQASEDVVSEAFLARGDSANFDLFGVGNWVRANLYLDDPSGWSLLFTDGTGSLEERGASWLFVRYMRGQFGGTSLLRSLTQTTLSSSENVTTTTGQSWERLLADWGAALYMDDRGISASPRLEFLDFELERTLDRLSDGFLFQPEGLPIGDAAVDALLIAAAQKHFFITVPTSGGIAVNLGGISGGTEASGAGLQLTLVRVQ